MNPKEIYQVKKEQLLLLVLNNSNSITYTRALTINSGLIWDSLVIDKPNLKTVLVKVSFEKKYFWVELFKNSYEFSYIDIDRKKLEKKHLV